MTARLTALIGVAALLAGAAGCGAGGGSTEAGTRAGFPMTVESCGRQVTIEEPPRRVLTERETSTALAAVGAADRIVARAGEGRFPLGRYADALRDTPQITPDSGDPPSREAVLGTGAQLVVAGHTSRQDVASLEQVGLDVLVPSWFCGEVSDNASPPTFEDVFRTLETYGRIFGTEETARRVVTDLRQRVEAVRRTLGAAGSPRTVADVFVAPDLLNVYGAPSLNNEAMTLLGLTNVFADTPERTADVSIESLLGRDPDVIIVSFNSDYGITDDADAVRTFRALPGAERLSAVQRGRLLTVNSSYLTGGPLAVDALEMLAGQLADLP